MAIQLLDAQQDRGNGDCWNGDLAWRAVLLRKRLNLASSQSIDREGDMQTEPMIACRNVQASSAWYCELFNADHDHDSDEFDRILRGGELLLMLHHWGGEEHGASMFDPDAGPVGNGVVLWFLVEDLDTIYERALEMGCNIVVEPHDNPLAHWREFSLRDPDGYTLAVAETGWE